MADENENDPRPHVVIVGGGFGGLTAAKSLKSAPVRITLIDRTNHHLFQPLLYQVATAGLSPADIAAPIRSVLRRQKNVSVLLDEVLDVDVAQKKLSMRGGALSFDKLICATGMTSNYFGHEAWEPSATGLKSLHEAVQIRNRALVAYEEAERETDPERRRALLTFVVIGGGATGVEVAGAFVELARFTLVKDFRRIHPDQARVILVEAGDRLLPAMPPELSESAKKQLEEMGVEVRLSTRVTDISGNSLSLGDELIKACTIVWGAGVKANPLAAKLGETDRLGRVKVEKDCSLPGHRDVFAIGDMMNLAGDDGNPLPGVAQVALQQAEHVANCIKNDLKNKPREAFRYNDLGSMATIGRSRAVAKIGKIELSGFLAWCGWLFVHPISLIGFRNRLSVFSSTGRAGLRHLPTRGALDRRSRSVAAAGRCVAPSADFTLHRARDADATACVMPDLIE
ncbi:MAG: NAD(P)/FAD-dependent oxidoreductase [Polyangiaceae bacterium]